MKRVLPLVFLIGILGGAAQAAEEAMPHMPRIQPRESFSVKNTAEGEALAEQRGFGDHEGEIRMMNLMMVEGSGMEGMEMSQATSPKSVVDKRAGSSSESGYYEIHAGLKPAQAHTGSNLLEIDVRDRKSATPASGLKLKVQVEMTTMDMGVEEPPVKEAAPGHYQVKVPFSMQGIWAVKVLLPDGTRESFEFQVKK